MQLRVLVSLTKGSVINSATCTVLPGPVIPIYSWLSSLALTPMHFCCITLSALQCARCDSNHTSIHVWSCPSALWEDIADARAWQGVMDVPSTVPLTMSHLITAQSPHLLSQEGLWVTVKRQLFSRTRERGGGSTLRSHLKTHEIHSIKRERCTATGRRGKEPETPKM